MGKATSSRLLPVAAEDVSPAVNGVTVGVAVGVGWGAIPQLGFIALMHPCTQWGWCPRQVGQADLTDRLLFECLRRCLGGRRFVRRAHTGKGVDEIDGGGERECESLRCSPLRWGHWV